MLSRDSKVIASGHQTKDSILLNSKHYPHLVNIKDHFEEVTGIRKRKGFHHLPSYKTDVLEVVNELTDQNVLTVNNQRRLQCRTLNPDRVFFFPAYKGLCTMIYRHKPVAPFRRLRDPHI